jgi:formate hydrogenlyase subunit 3/multisubunit Na+/H+ antiporter MnhD subunit
MGILDGILIAIAGLGGTALLALAPGRSPARIRLIYGLSAGFSAIILGLAFLHLAAGAEPLRRVLPVGLPWYLVALRRKALSASFLIVIALAARCLGVRPGLWRACGGTPAGAAFFPPFLAGMMLAPLADDAFTFLVAWEAMSLSSWALVISDHRGESNRRAAYLYIVMACFGTLMLLFAFGTMAGPDGDYTFDAMRGRTLPVWGAAATFALATLGAGSKAGLAPLHVWLPEAHPAAPSHVSALMSGVMTKVAVYAFIRIVFDLAGEPSWWWGLPLLVQATATAFLGLLYALLQKDIKRILAYSTVENIGIIFFCLGLALVFRAEGLSGSAALAFCAALFHALNHAVFKSLLFMASGAVLHATGERDIERLGGLIHRMPKTAGLFLIGAAAISALPPLNGFASEWLMFQSVLISPAIGQPLMKFMVPLAGAVLAIAAALAAACFVRAFGIAFLGRARSDAAARAHETDGFSLAAMGVAAALCVVLGVLGPLVVEFLAPVSALIVGGTMPDQSIGPAPLSLIPVDETRSSYNAFIILPFIIVSSLGTGWAIHRVAARGSRKGAPGTAAIDASPLTHYSASSFSQRSAWVIAGVLFHAREHDEMAGPRQHAPARFSVTTGTRHGTWRSPPSSAPSRP